MRHILVTSSSAAMGAIHLNQDLEVLDFYGKRIYWREEGGGHLYKALNKQFVRLRKCKWQDPICICTFENVNEMSSKLNAKGLKVYYKQIELTQDLNDIREQLLHTALDF